MANIAKLTSDQISEMRRLYSEGVSQKSLAERYHVSITTVSKKLKATPSEEPPGIGTFSPEARAEIDALPIPTFIQLQVEKKKEPPKRRIVGVNI